MRTAAATGDTLCYACVRILSHQSRSRVANSGVVETSHRYQRRRGYGNDAVSEKAFHSGVAGRPIPWSLVNGERRKQIAEFRARICGSASPYAPSSSPPRLAALPGAGTRTQHIGAQKRARERSAARSGSFRITTAAPSDHYRQTSRILGAALSTPNCSRVYVDLRSYCCRRPR